MGSRNSSAIEFLVEAQFEVLGSQSSTAVDFLGGNLKFLISVATHINLVPGKSISNKDPERVRTSLKVSCQMSD